MTDDQTTTAPHQTPEPPPPPFEPPPMSGPQAPTPPTPPAPAWRPPPADHGRSVSLIFGVILLAVGGWFFATETLGLDLPRLDWDQLWPLILIVAGIWIVWRSTRQAH